MYVCMYKKSSDCRRSYAIVSLALFGYVESGMIWLNGGDISDEVEVET